MADCVTCSAGWLAIHWDHICRRHSYPVTDCPYLTFLMVVSMCWLQCDSCWKKDWRSAFRYIFFIVSSQVHLSYVFCAWKAKISVCFPSYQLHLSTLRSGLKSHLFSLSYHNFWSHLFNACTVTFYFGPYNRYYIYIFAFCWCWWYECGIILNKMLP